MIWMSLAALAAEKVDIDFEGNGKTVSVSFDDNTYKVKVGKREYECDTGMCTFEVHDISSDTKGKELAICSHGERDDVDCHLHTMVGGKLTRIPVPESYYAPVVKTSGNGIVLAIDGYRNRLFTSTRKFVYREGALVETLQPILSADKPRPLKIDRTFPILLEAGGKTVVANVRPSSVINILGEHGTKEGWMLVRLSSGVTGWCDLAALEKASNEYMMIMGAG